MFKELKVVVYIVFMIFSLITSNTHASKCDSYLEVRFWMNMDVYIPTVFVVSKECDLIDLYPKEYHLSRPDIRFFTSMEVLKEIRDKVVSIKEQEGFFPMTEIVYGGKINKVYTVAEGKVFLENIVSIVNDDAFTSQVNSRVQNMVHEEYNADIILEPFTPIDDL